MPTCALIIAELIEYCPISKWEQQVSDNALMEEKKEEESKEKKELKRLLGKYGMGDAQ